MEWPLESVSSLKVVKSDMKSSSKLDSVLDSLVKSNVDDASSA